MRADEPGPIVLVNGPVGLAERLTAVWGTAVRPMPVGSPRGTVVFVDDVLAAAPETVLLIPGCMAIMARASEDLIEPVAMCGAGAVVVVSESDAVLRLAWAAWQGGARLLSPVVAANLLYPLYGSALRIAGRAWGRTLTGREAQVLGYLLLGTPNVDIAAAMSIRRSTVESHVRSILRKYGVADRLQLAVAHLSGRLRPGLGRRDDIHARMDVAQRSTSLPCERGTPGSIRL